MKPSDLPARIAAHIQVDEETGCWLWTRKLGRAGYGRMWWEGPRLANPPAYLSPPRPATLRVGDR